MHEDDNNNNNDIDEVIDGLTEIGSLKELSNLVDIRTKELLDPDYLLEQIQGFKASQKLLHQAEMLNPVSAVIIMVNARGELYVMSTESEPAYVLHMVETAKKRLV